MANTAVWNNRLRHEWLSKPRKSKYLSKRARERCGLQESLDRKAGLLDEPAAEEAADA